MEEEQLPAVIQQMEERVQREAAPEVILDVNSWKELLATP